MYKYLCVDAIVRQMFTKYKLILFYFYEVKLYLFVNNLI